jgi:glycosyltransferase involved in cell wall biosynthesis
MKVSVIIPAYNEEKYIKKCLRSILKQTVKADEIIVVDNNCCDKTATIAKKHGAKVVKERVQGMTPARNRGFNAAKYDILARIDADAIAPPDWIEKIVKNFESKNIDALSGPVVYYDFPMIPKSANFSKIAFKSLGLVSRGRKYLTGANMALTKKIWEKVKDKVNMDDKKVHEDIDLSLKIFKAGGIIGFDNRLVVQFSARRLVKNPSSFFLEYPIRTVRTFIANRK